MNEATLYASITGKDLIKLQGTFDSCLATAHVLIDTVSCFSCEIETVINTYSIISVNDIYEIERYNHA